MKFNNHISVGLHSILKIIKIKKKHIYGNYRHSSSTMIGIRYNVRKKYSPLIHSKIRQIMVPAGRHKQVLCLAYIPPAPIP